jgi:hypothetical protein
VYAILSDPSFWPFLLRLDEDLAAEVRAACCPHCDAPLHSGHYPRKPRGVARSVLGPGYERRLSLCCSREGCRRRVTPPSVRFFGRRVFLGAVVVLISALSQGLTGKRRAWLAEQIGAGAETLERWRRWWREVFPATRSWQALRGELLPPLPSAALPGALLARFGALEDARTLLSTLRFLAPWSVACEQAR